METVIKWTKNENLCFEKDKRGWTKDKPRKYINNEEKKIINIYHNLKNDPLSFFCGATAIANVWKRIYPSKPVPHLRFIGRILKKHNLTKKIDRGKNKGASRYLLYPDYTILNNIGKNSLLEIDYIGQKFIKGQTEPINFLAFSLRGKRTLKYYVRTRFLTQDELMQHLKYFFNTYEKPVACKMDNAFVFFGPSSKGKFLSKTVLFLLSNNVIPIFTAPRKPWNQASVEGAGSIFARKFWNRFHFNNVLEIDKKLGEFNFDYMRYLNYQSPDKTEDNSDFSYCVYFIRKVYEKDKNTGYVGIGNEQIDIDSSYINLFTLCEWNLEKETLSIYLQREGVSDNGKCSFHLKLIKKITFEISKGSEVKAVDFYMSLNR